VGWMPGKRNQGHASVSVRKPLARSDDLVTEELGDELLVYDSTNKRAHSLSAPAARVWRACDGNTDVEGLSGALELPRETVLRALEELEHAELLESYGLQIVDSGSGNDKGLTRRQMTIRSAKIGTAVAVAPMLYSIAVPSPAAAATPTNFACELFSIDSCGNSVGGGSIKGCCCCCEASGASTPSCKLATAINGCPSFTCFNGTLGHCTGAPGSQPFTNGGCCGLSTTVPDFCGCAWGRPLNGKETTTNG